MPRSSRSRRTSGSVRAAKADPGDSKPARDVFDPAAQAGMEMDVVMRVEMRDANADVERPVDLSRQLLDHRRANASGERGGSEEARERRESSVDAQKSR